MSEKKQLNEEQLEKVSGGVTYGKKNIVECENCGTQFDPGAVESRLNVVEESEIGSYGYETYKYSTCKKFHHVKVIQLKKENLVFV